MAMVPSELPSDDCQKDDRYDRLLEYVDADGTKCYFYYDKEKKEWKDELGKEMTLKVNGDTSKEPYVIESKDHSRMVFGGRPSDPYH